MKSTSIFSLLLALPLFLTLVASTAPTPATAPAIVTAIGTSPINLIPKACGNSTQKALCVSIFNAEPTAKNADLQGLAFIALKAAANTAANTSMQIHSLLIKGCPDQPQLEDGLASCSDSYLDVVDQIEDSMDALVAKNIKNANTWMRAAFADVSTCDGSLQGQSAPVAKDLLKKNRVVQGLCKNAVEVVRVLNHNRHS